MLLAQLRALGAESRGPAIRRWALLVLAGVAIGGLAAFLVSRAIQPEYRATAQLYLAPAANPTLALQDVLLGQSLTRSYVELATADVVYGPAMTAVGRSDLNSFRAHAQVAQVRDTGLIGVSFRDSDPRLAADAANAIVDSFLKQSPKLQSTLQAIVILWQPATVPAEPESPRVALNTLLGALAGGLVAVLGIVVARRIDDRLRTPDEVRDRLGMVPLGEIERMERMSSQELVLRDAPASREADAFRTLRTNILFAGVDRHPQTILVTSALSGEGKSVVSANLALAFAAAGSSTILVDADFRRPRQTALFGRAQSVVGLTQLLTGPLSPESLEQTRMTPHLLVIRSGPLPPNPAELLGSDRMSSLMRELARFGDGSIVIIDTSPVLIFSDAIALAAKVDACVLVIDSERTHVAVARRAVTALKGVRAVVLGAVLNRVRGGDLYGYDDYHAEESVDTSQSG
jgi:succinoglycan biosynthesis transport protein ExoP